MSYGTAQLLFISGLVTLLGLILFAMLKAGREADEEARWEAMRLRAERFTEEFEVLPLHPTDYEAAEVIVAAESFAREASIR